MQKKTLSERYRNSHNSQKELFDEVISKIKFDSDQDNHDDWIMALLTGYSYISEDQFHQLTDLAADSPFFYENPEFQYFFYLARGNYFRKKMVLHHALENFEYAFRTAQSSDSQDQIIKALVNIAGIYFLNTDHDSCEHYTRKAIAIAQKEDSHNIIADLYNGLCALYLNSKKYQAAYDSGTEALEYYSRNPDFNNRLNYCICLLNCGDACYYLGEKKKSKKLYDQGISLAIENEFLDQIQNNLDDIADFYYSEGDYHRAYMILKAYKRGAFEMQISSEKLDNQVKKQQLKIEIDSLITMRKDNMILQKRIDNLKQHYRNYQNPLEDRKILMDQLIIALANNEIKTYFQPKVCVGTKAIIGAEALVRWIRPNGEQVAPDEFIPVIEDSYVIQDITEKVMKDSFSFCGSINKDFDPNFSMSINIAPSQLHDSTLVYMLKKELLVSGVNPKNIELEIIERSLLDQNSQVKSSLNKLQSLGISFSLDDFGIGYSSLSVLNSSLFNSIKIDRSLLMSALKNEKAEFLLKGIVRLLESMGYEVVVEGLENKGHYDLIRGMKCKYAQGYYFSKPVSEDDFYSLLNL